MFTRQNILRLLLVGLLLAMLAIPVFGAALGAGAAANAASHSTLVHHSGPTTADGLAIACDDPGGNQGGGC